MDALGSRSLTLAATRRAGTDLAWLAFDAILNVAMIVEEEELGTRGILKPLSLLGLESLGDSLNESLSLGGSSRRASWGHFQTTASELLLLVVALLQDGVKDLTTNNAMHRNESADYAILPAISSPPLPRTTYYDTEGVGDILGQEKGQSGSAEQDEESQSKLPQR